MKTELLEKTSTPVYKYCNICKQTKLVTLFHRDRGGLNSNCASCCNSYSRKWRLAHPDYQREWMFRQNDYYRNWANAHPNYQMERYHRIQEEAGCHWKPISFLSAHRLIQALETAEVVEIKL